MYTLQYNGFLRKLNNIEQSRKNWMLLRMCYSVSWLCEHLRCTWGHVKNFEFRFFLLYNCEEMKLQSCCHSSQSWRGFPGGSDGKNLPVMWETCVRSLGQEDPLEEGMTTHSNILSWRVPWTEEPGTLQSMRSQESDMTEELMLDGEVSQKHKGLGWICLQDS